MICLLASKTEQLALCRVCQHLKLICTRLIYHTVFADETNPIKFIQLCRTLTKVPAAAIAVRELRMEMSSPSHRYRRLGSICRIFRDALLKTTSLTTLCFCNRWRQGEPSLYLQGCDFPQLKNFTVEYNASGHGDDAIYKFISRHSTTISTLCIRSFCRFDGQGKMATSYKPLALPKLLMYGGSDAWLDVIIPINKPNFVYLSSSDCLPNPLQPSAIDHLSCILALSKGGIQDFRLDFDRWDTRILAMFHQLTDLTTLVLSVVTNPPVVFPLKFFDALEKQCLPRMTQLRRLHLRNAIYIVDDDDIEEIYDRDYELEYIRRWHKICPQLEDVRFPTRHYWKLVKWNRSESTIWVPSNDFNHQGGLIWATTAIAVGHYPVNLKTLPKEVDDAVLRIQNKFPSWIGKRDIDAMYAICASTLDWSTYV
ncbi:hypothetical protein HGRIS_004199 [Hohenbuehelia grisea]|uniref:Uncharacterized protein n=1 Tax=Hohenbuehelia grisea TaxID=104357 RepID=A0ABR3JJ08_9AGAR